jgi:hypothetical protein
MQDISGQSTVKSGHAGCGRPNGRAAATVFGWHGRADVAGQFFDVSGHAILMENPAGYAAHPRLPASVVAGPAKELLPVRQTEMPARHESARKDKNKNSRPPQDGAHVVQRMNGMHCTNRIEV